MCRSTAIVKHHKLVEVEDEKKLLNLYSYPSQMSSWAKPKLSLGANYISIINPGPTAILLGHGLMNLLPLRG